ncbi:hypothetical protein [Alcanivorax sp.]|uniref:hypothetical protein n=1 Tax=Alcanivorax sp. TaxID=1872427 RepID=UPI0025C0E1F6|nr:hypothetical protein [Alcanivorax sp.]
MAVLTNKQFYIAGAVAVVGVGALVWLGKKGAEAAVDTVEGIASGDNAMTEGTPYQGAGVLGTLGAGMNKLLGGAPEAIGTSEALSDFIWWAFGDEPDMNL